MPGKGAIVQKPFWWGNIVVEGGLLQIQHTDGNDLLRRVNSKLIAQGLQAFIALKLHCTRVHMRLVNA